MIPAAPLLLCGALLAIAPVMPPADVAAQLDALVESRLKELTVAPAAPADDAAFLRRVWLDLAGRVPPALTTREFLADRDPGRRNRLVDTLLAGEDFADHWGRVWTQALTGRRPIRFEKYDGRVLHEYLRASFQANKPYRQLVSELICGEGLNDASGPANFLIRYEAKPTDLAGAVGKQFLGVSLQCAQCHDHPFAKWKQPDFWGVAAFFGRIRLLEMNEDNAYYAAILETRRGELLVTDPDAKPDKEGQRPKKKLEPRLPGGQGAVITGNRRQALAAWVTAADNPYFAKHAVNRVWAQLFGAALVSPLDGTNASDGLEAQVLNLLAADFGANGYDVKRLVRVILSSRTYQQDAAAESVEASGSRRPLPFARFPVRPLTVDQLYASIVQATGHRGEPEDQAEAASDEEEGTTDRATELLTERALTVQRSLALLNGDYVHKAVRSGATTALTVNGRRLGPASVEWLFLATLARRPTTEEATAMLKLAQEAKNARQGLEDVLWVILNSAEFTTNH